jgi:hypothetical protein
LSRAWRRAANLDQVAKLQGHLKVLGWFAGQVKESLCA